MFAKKWIRLCSHIILCSAAWLGQSAHADPLTQGGLVGLYTFDNSSNLGLDSSGQGHNLISHGAPFYTASGVSGGALALDGSSFLRSTFSVSPTDMPDMTWGAWVNAASVNGQVRAVLSNDNGDFDRDIGIDTRNGVSAGSTPGWATFNGSGVVQSGVGASTSDWTFLAVSYSQSTQSLSFYVNDNAAVTVSTSFGSAHSYFDVGHNPLGTEFFVGLIDQVFIYDKALTEEEIGEVYSGNFTLSAVPEPETYTLMFMGLMVLGFADKRLRTLNIQG